MNDWESESRNNSGESDFTHDEMQDSAAAAATYSEGYEHGDLSAEQQSLIQEGMDLLLSCREDSSGTKVLNGFYPSRSGDIFVILEPYWLFGGGTGGTTHGTTLDYDTHVPVIFLGVGIKPGKYYGAITVNDIAPTLAALLGVEQPSGTAGRILSEIFTKEVN